MQTKWIWTKIEPSENLYAIARTQFEYAGNGTPELRISADSNFAAFLNGQFLGCGQFSDFPDAKTYTVIPLQPRRGKNQLEIKLYSCGSNFLTHIKGAPGLWAEVIENGAILTRSGRDWLMADDPAFRAGNMEKVNPMYGYTWEYDARKDRPHFAPAQEFERSGVPIPRPVPMLMPGEALPTSVVFHGFLKRRDKTAAPGMAMATDMLMTIPVPFSGTFEALPSDTDGFVLLVDLGQESTGLLHFEVTAPAGTALDIAHGEHFELGRVLCASSDPERYYADRYVCHEGRNEFTQYFRRYGARYLELHVTGATGSVTVHSLTLLPTMLPLPYRAPFRAPDRLLEAEHKTAMRTLELCMHEHYEDCPWREQALYGYDSRNQMLFGYYAFGNYGFAAASLDLLGKSMMRNGFLNLTAPGDLGLYIPIFTFAWLTALREHELYSGSRQPYLLHRDRILQALPNYTRRPCGNGLYLPPEDLPESRTWNFCEWVPGLDGEGPGGKESCADAEVPTAFYNLYLAEALQAVAALEDSRDLREQAEALGKSAEAGFWNETEKCYATRSDDKRFHSHVQYLMLALDLVPEEKRAMVMDAALSDRLIQPTFSSYLYMIRALCGNGRGGIADAILKRDFDRMSLSGATSFWEVPGGLHGFTGGYGGSLCHGWSCANLYFDGACRLGVVPLEPGFRSFSVNVVPGLLDSLEGEVPTPYGPIRVAWHRENGKIIVQTDAPPETCQKR